MDIGQFLSLKACHQDLLLDLSHGGCINIDAETMSVHSMYMRCTFALLLLTEVTFLSG